MGVRLLSYKASAASLLFFLMSEILKSMVVWFVPTHFRNMVQVHENSERTSLRFTDLSQLN